MSSLSSLPIRPVNDSVVGSGRTTSQESRRVPSGRAWSVEALERRRLLSAADASVQVRLMADPGDATKTALIVVGTEANDRISFKPGPVSGSVSVRVNGRLHGTFEPTGRIIANGLDGEDNISVSPSISLPTILRGGDGQDRLKGGAGPNVLIGGRGPDVLTGGAARDILAGGSNLDRLQGRQDDDVLIGGSTEFDNHDKALCALLEEWTSARVYDVRVQNMRDGEGSTDARNGSFFLHAGTVREEASGDRLKGSVGRDWFLLRIVQDQNSDRARDAQPDERIDLL